MGTEIGLGNVVQHSFKQWLGWRSAGGLEQDCGGLADGADGADGAAPRRGVEYAFKLNRNVSGRASHLRQPHEATHE